VTSRDSVVVRSGSGLSAHNPVLCLVRELAAFARWCASTRSRILARTELGVALTFILAPLPNALFSHCGQDDFGGDYETSGPVDLGRFLTSIVVVTGFALPIVLAHSEVIKPAASLMSIIGGGYVYRVAWTG
jgi:hypothetical protein